jgi:hypothetical protein
MVLLSYSRPLIKEGLAQLHAEVDVPSSPSARGKETTIL